MNFHLKDILLMKDNENKTMNLTNFVEIKNKSK